MRILGEGIFVGADGRRHTLEGIGNFPDDMPLQSLAVEGIFSFKNFSCDKVKIEGECSGKSLTAKKISVEGIFDVDAAQTETFQVSGSIDTNKLTAEEIIIESSAGSIDEIKCARLKIFHDENFFRRQSSRIRIKNIDAEKVELENCAVDVIKCKDALIGTNCAIKKLFVAGEYKVADDSTVGETIRAKSDS